MPLANPSAPNRMAPSVTPNAAATIVAKPYWAFARVLARSFRERHPDIPFYVLLADEADERIRPEHEPFTIVTLDEVALPHRERMCFHYGQQPLSYACTPWLLASLLARGHSRVVFFKQETLILGAVDSLFERLESASILLTPHVLAPLGSDGAPRELNVLLSGIFNVGILGVSASPTTSRFLEWWQDRLVLGCRHDVAAGMHFEQRWLDLVPGYFSPVAILRDPAYNVGHWNLTERGISRDDSGTLLAEGRPCRVFRFSGYDFARPTTITRYNTRVSWAAAGAAVRSVFEDFHRRLLEEGEAESSQWPYAYATFDNGVRIPDAARRVLLDADETTATAGDPRVTGTATSFWNYLQAPVHANTRVTRLWHQVYRSRPDLGRAFPLVPGADEDRFLEWTRTSGCREHDIAERLLPGAPA